MTSAFDSKGALRQSRQQDSRRNLDGTGRFEDAEWVDIDLLRCPISAGEAVIRRASFEKYPFSPKGNLEGVALQGG